jgi:hypothetical protein
MKRLLFGLLLCGAGCDDGLLGAGQPCETSSECGPGLLCDYGQTPHACAGMSSVSSDLAGSATDANVGDLAMQQPSDGPAPPPADMTTPPDLTSLPDLTTTD